MKRHFDADWIFYSILMLLFVVYFWRWSEGAIKCHDHGGAYVQTMFWFDCVKPEDKP
jgi:hypothetical protein